MAIQIGGTTVINNSRNITNVGIITVGTGGTSGTLKVGTGVTIDGAGNAYFDGFITVNGGINYLVGLTSIYPQNEDLSNNSIYDAWDGDLFLYFDSQVEVSAGSTLKIELKKNTTGSVGIRTAGISSISYPGGDFSVLKVGFGSLSVPPGSGIATYFPIIPTGIIKFSSNSNNYAGNYSGDPQQNQISFKFQGTSLGSAHLGGFLMCASAGIKWIVSPCSAEVTRTWYSRDDASTRAQEVSGCTGWFVPTVSQLQNPGYCCRSFWGPSPCYSASTYWSSQRVHPTSASACGVSFNGGHTSNTFSDQSRVVRAFRCVTY
jgi:hypothetical protein